MRFSLNLAAIDKIFKEEEALLIVLHEKHGEHYAVGSTPEGFFNFFLSILEERKEMGYYYEPEVPKPTSMSIEAVNALPEGPVKKAGLKEIEYYADSLERYKERKKEYDAIKKAISEKNGRLAYSLLKRRSDQGAEYEEMTVEKAKVL